MKIPSKEMSQERQRLITTGKKHVALSGLADDIFVTQWNKLNETNEKEQWTYQEVGPD